jgi:hypothetical protein
MNRRPATVRLPETLRISRHLHEHGLWSFLKLRSTPGPPGKEELSPAMFRKPQPKVRPGGPRSIQTQDYFIGDLEEKPLIIRPGCLRSIETQDCFHQTNLRAALIMRPEYLHSNLLANDGKQTRFCDGINTLYTETVHKVGLFVPLQILVRQLQKVVSRGLDRVDIVTGFLCSRWRRCSGGVKDGGICAFSMGDDSPVTNSLGHPDLRTSFAPRASWLHLQLLLPGLEWKNRSSPTVQRRLTSLAHGVKGFEDLHVKVQQSQSVGLTSQFALPDCHSATRDCREISCEVL